MIVRLRFIAFVFYSFFVSSDLQRIALSPDGSRVTLSMLEIRHRLMLAEGVPGVLVPSSEE